MLGPWIALAVALAAGDPTQAATPAPGTADAKPVSGPDAKAGGGSSDANAAPAARAPVAGGATPPDAPKVERGTATPSAGTPRPAAQPGTRAPLKLDLQKAIEEIYARHMTGGLPRFEEQVEVRDRMQEGLEAQLEGIGDLCGEAAAGAPAAAELNRFRGAPVPVHADFIGAAKLLYKGGRRLFGSKKQRYFLYAVHTLPPAGEPAQVPELVVREGQISEAARASVPGTTWELVSGFRERDEALAALDRLRRGFATLRRAHADERLPPWVNSNCRPRR